MEIEALAQRGHNQAESRRSSPCQGDSRSHQHQGEAWQGLSCDAVPQPPGLLMMTASCLCSNFQDQGPGASDLPATGLWCFVEAAHRPTRVTHK